jgi:hypothetical protein
MPKGICDSCRWPCDDSQKLCSACRRDNAANAEGRTSRVSNGKSESTRIRPLGCDPELKRRWFGLAPKITFYCPKCRLHLVSPMADVGDDDQCQRCGTEFTVPGEQIKQEWLLENLQNTPLSLHRLEEGAAGSGSWLTDLIALAIIGAFCFWIHYSVGWDGISDLFWFSLFIVVLVLAIVIVGGLFLLLIGGISTLLGMATNNHTESNTQVQARNRNQDAHMICPHCQKKGTVRTSSIPVKTGISGAKVGLAALFGVYTFLFTGISSYRSGTGAKCSKCGNEWQY